MYDVFISYSSMNQHEAENLCNVLEKNKIRCWIAPRNIPVGANYTKAIPTAIRECQFFAVIVTQKAQNSRFVLKELEYAVSLGKTIIPFMQENCHLNDEFRFLIGIEQHLRAYEKSEKSIEQELVYRIRQKNPPPLTIEDTGGQTQSHTVNLAIIRKNQFVGYASAIKITMENGKEERIRCGNTITLPFTVGEHILLFSCFRVVTKVKVKLNRDSTIRIGFNAWNGHIDVEPVSQMDMTVLEVR